MTGLKTTVIFSQGKITFKYEDRKRFFTISENPVYHENSNKKKEGEWTVQGWHMVVFAVDDCLDLILICMGWHFVAKHWPTHGLWIRLLPPQTLWGYNWMYTAVCLFLKSCNSMLEV